VLAYQLALGRGDFQFQFLGHTYALFNASDRSSVQVRERRPGSEKRAASHWAV
jgi:hypothetical protein